MNKVLTNILLFSILIFTQCKSVSSKIKITQKKVNQEVILRTASDNKNRALRIQFPNGITLSNNSTKKYDLLTLNYRYNNIPPNRNLNLGLFVYKNGKIERIRNNKKKILPSNQSLNFIFYSRHFVDSSKAIQQQFKPYIEKMLSENKDTLHIGTVTAFKKKHKELFEKLTKGDSLSIQFLDGKKLGEKITVPVKW